MDKTIEIKNTFFKTLLSYDKDLKILYIQIEENGPVWSYEGCEEKLYNKILKMNEDSIPLGTMIITLNDNDVFGKKTKRNSL